MPRDARKIPLEGYLHIISRGNNRRKIFRYQRDKKQYYLYLKKLKREEKIDIYHYCLMGNHIHLMVRVEENSNLSRFMKRVNLKYVHCYQRRYTYFGHLWQDRFQSKIIDSEAYLLRCGKYIELNPIRAGIVSSPEDYRFSSYSYYAFGRKDALVTPNFFYQDFGKKEKEKQRRYRELIIETENLKRYNYVFISD